MAKLLFGAIILLCALVSTCLGYPNLLLGISKRQISVGDLKDSYDYIIVGGGQSGLVIANRLSEDASKTVLVIEYGTFDNDPNQVEPSSAVNYLPRDRFNVTSVPQPGLGNRQTPAWAAAVVGGGSTINGMFFLRGSAEDYDNWEKLGNPGWGWDDLLPYFKRSTQFNTPSDLDIVRQYNITYDTRFFGTNGPIQVTYPPWQWPTTKIQFQAWNDIGVQTQYEAAAGKSYNAFWVPNNVDPQIRRSYARNRYFDPVQNRTNLHLLTYYRVNEVLFSPTKHAEAVTIQARETADGSETRVITVRADQEIVLCAGWLHTPHILQRSGVGPKALLQQAGIHIVNDLPGVGSNLQDHSGTGMQFQYTTDVFPNPGSLSSNATFLTWAQQQWQQRKGPLSIGVGNSVVYLPLPKMNSNYKTIITKAKSQNASAYLPKSYTVETLAGFRAQRDILLASYASSTNGIIEVTFEGSPSPGLFLQKPLSRGTVTINATDLYAEPAIDFNTAINPVDMDLLVSAVKFSRTWMAAPSMQQLGPVELAPGTNVTSDLDIGAWATQSMSSSTAHSCCTAAMMPKHLGGVVSSDLLVYGVTGLSVGDISIIPLVPAAHTCATVYAIAEKAADMIKRRTRSSSGDLGATTIIADNEHDKRDDDYGANADQLAAIWRKRID